ncbi:MAG: MlaD family protein [Rhodothermales bacterium]
MWTHTQKLPTIVKYSNELKVGIAIVAAVVVFVLGVRYFQDVPLFRGTYDLNSSFESAGGLIAGNPVRVSGVGVGKVREVKLNSETGMVDVRIRIDEGIRIPEGSTATVTGFDALGAVQLTVDLGPASNPAIPPGGTLPAAQGADLLGDLSDRAPQLMDKIDSVLLGLDERLDEAGTLYTNPQGEMAQLLISARTTSETLSRVLQQEQSRLRSVLDNTTQLTADLGTTARSTGDSLKITLNRLNGTLETLDTQIAGLDETTARLNSILRKIDEGEGTLGMMINDPSLYHRLDSTTASMNALLQDIEEDPIKYFRALRLVDIF